MNLPPFWSLGYLFLSSAGKCQTKLHDVWGFPCKPNLRQKLARHPIYVVLHIEVGFLLISGKNKKIQNINLPWYIDEFDSTHQKKTNVELFLDKSMDKSTVRYPPGN